MKTYLRLTIFFIGFLCALPALCRQRVEVKPRVVVSTDIGGTDPDDNQSVAHLLMYTDQIDLEGIISSPSYGDGSTSEVLRMIDIYEQDLPRLRKGIDGLAAPEYLRSITKQGRHGAVGFAGIAAATEGSEWIVQCARRTDDPRPLWVIVWGGLDDVAQALADAPDIAPRIRVYWIGGPNKKWSVHSYAYIAQHFPDLWMIECNAAYRGFIASKKTDDEWNAMFYEQHLRGRGMTGADFAAYYGGLPKMGDTPSLLYLLDGDPERPDGESWGGSFQPVSFSPRRVFHRHTDRRDTASVYSLIEWHLRGPVRDDISPDSVCLTLTIARQTWPGYYVGDGEYVVRHSTYALGTLPYEVRWHVAGGEDAAGEITIANDWPGPRTADDYPLGNTWWTDPSEAAAMWHNLHGAATVYKWREEVMADWAARLDLLKE